MTVAAGDRLWREHVRVTESERVKPAIKSLREAALKPLAITVCPVPGCRTRLRFEPRHGGYVAICPACEERVRRMAVLEKALGMTGKAISVFGSAKHRSKKVGTIVVLDCHECGNKYRGIITGGPHRLYCDVCRTRRHRRQARESYIRRGVAKPLGSPVVLSCDRCGAEFPDVVRKTQRRYCDACVRPHALEIRRAHNAKVRANKGTQCSGLAPSSGGSNG